MSDPIDDTSGRLAGAATTSPGQAAASLPRQGELQMPLLDSSAARSDAPSASTDHDGLLHLTGGFGRYQMRVCVAAWVIEANFVTLIMIGVLLVPRLRDVWQLTPVDEGLLSTAFFAGTFVGQAVLGALSDWLGRRLVLLVALPCGWACVLGMFASWDVPSMCLARALGGFFLGGSLISGYVTFFEMTVERLRVHAKVLMVVIGWTAVALVITLIAYLLRDLSWRATVIAALLPAPLALLFLQADSPRFHAERGQNEKALGVLEEIARVNRVQLPPGTLARALAGVMPQSSIPLSDLSTPAQQRQVASSTAESARANGVTGEQSILPAAISSPIIHGRRQLLVTLLVSLAWFGSVCAYYGVVLWPLEVDNVYSRTALGMLLEVPGYTFMYVAGTPRCRSCLPLLFGSATCAMIRSNSTIGHYHARARSHMLVSCVCALVVLWSSRLWLFSQVWSAAAWGLIAIFGVDGVTGTLLLLHARLATTIVSTIPYVASAEAFPTATRSCGVGFAASSGRLGSVLAPLLVNLLPTTSTRAGTLVVISGAAALCTAALVCGLRAGAATDAKREGERDWQSAADTA